MPLSQTPKSIPLQFKPNDLGLPGSFGPTVSSSQVIRTQIAVPKSCEIQDVPENWKEMRLGTSKDTPVSAP